MSSFCKDPFQVYLATACRLYPNGLFCLLLTGTIMWLYGSCKTTKLSNFLVVTGATQRWVVCVHIQLYIFEPESEEESGQTSWIKCMNGGRFVQSCGVQSSNMLTSHLSCHSNIQNVCTIDVFGKSLARYSLSLLNKAEWFFIRGPL